MFANTVLTIILGIVSLALLSDVFAFWNDRTTFGNAIMVTAVSFTISWFFIGIYNAW